MGRAIKHQINKLKMQVTRTHDKLVLQYLECLNNNNNDPACEAVSQKFNMLNVIWKVYCQKKGLLPKSYNIFADQIGRILADLNKIPQPLTNAVPIVGNEHEGKSVNLQP